MTVEYQKVWRTMNDLEMVTSKICSAREIIDNAVDKIQGNEYDKAELLMTAAYEFLEYYLQEFDDKFKLAWQATVGDLRDGDREAYNAAMRERDYYENVMPSATQKDIENFEKLQNTILWPPEKEKSDKPNLTCDKDDPSPECKGAWDSFWEENQQYTEEELNAMCDAAEKKHSKYYYDYDRNDPDRPNPFPQTRWILPVEEVKDTDTDKTEYFVSFPQDLLEAAKLKEGDEIEWVDQGDGSFKIVKVTKPLGPDEC